MTIAIRPSRGVDRGSYRVICDFGKQEYFFGGDWTGRNSLIRLRKLDFTRKICGTRAEVRIYERLEDLPAKYDGGKYRLVPYCHACVLTKLIV